MEEKKQKIAIDCDDAAADLKKVIYDFLSDRGYDITDLDYSGQNRGPAMYPDIGFHLAERVKNGEFDRGILLCGTGLGMAIVANKVEGVYAGVCHDVYSAERLRKSNNAQIITLGARVVGPELAKKIIDAWVNSEFEGKGSLPKVNRIYELEQKSFGCREK
jgi:ribose 5-phosphate isomerase B